MLQIVTTHDLVVGDGEVNLENHSRCLLGNNRDLKERKSYWLPLLPLEPRGERTMFWPPNGCFFGL